MKIIAFFHTEGSGGSRREMYEFAKQFQRDGYIIKTYTTTLSDDWHLPMGSFGEEIKVPVKRTGYISFPGITGFSKVSAELKLLDNVEKVERQIAKDIEKEKPKFVFIHHSKPVQSPYLLKYLKNIPSVYFCAEPMRRFYESYPSRIYKKKGAISNFFDVLYSPANKAYLSRVKRNDRKNIESANVVVTNSLYTADYIKSVYFVEAYACHLGVDLNKFTKSDLERDKFFLSVGAISPLKGYDFLIKSIGKLDRMHRLPLVIVGNTVGKNELSFLMSLSKENDVELKCLEIL